ncbi:MAG: SGNH/GDSL hydrolase family protein [Scytonema sp. RU_4_4]|nr:SGNH/GDSL hydrolase family protein [Scytonema sp. RU_4_4]
MLEKFLTHRTLLRYDEQLGHLYVPNLTMRIPYSEKPYFVSTNKQGFRSNIDYIHQKTIDQPRIVFLGDSYVAGDGVANEKRFSDIVATEFSVDSYNFGLSGSGVDQQYLIYKNIASSYEHDLVVIAPHITNILRNSLDKRVAIDGYTGCKIAIPKPFFTLENENLILHNIPVPKEREFVLDNTGSTRLFEPNPRLKQLFNTYIPQKLKARLLRLQWSKELDGYQSENHPKWLLMKRLLAEIINLAGKKHILLVPLPYHYQG